MRNVEALARGLAERNRGEPGVPDPEAFADQLLMVPLGLEIDGHSTGLGLFMKRDLSSPGEIMDRVEKDDTIEFPGGVLSDGRARRFHLNGRGVSGVARKHSGRSGRECMTSHGHESAFGLEPASSKPRGGSKL